MWRNAEPGQNDRAGPDGSATVRNCTLCRVSCLIGRDGDGQDLR